MSANPRNPDALPGSISDDWLDTDPLREMSEGSRTAEPVVEGLGEDSEDWFDGDPICTVANGVQSSLSRMK